MFFDDMMMVMTTILVMMTTMIGTGLRRRSCLGDDDVGDRGDNYDSFEDDEQWQQS